MKINSMKFSIVLFLLFIVSGIIAGLFFVEIPDGNSEVSYTLLGAVSTILVTSIAELFRKPSDH